MPPPARDRSAFLAVIAVAQALRHTIAILICAERRGRYHSSWVLRQRPVDDGRRLRRQKRHRNRIWGGNHLRGRKRNHLRNGRTTARDAGHGQKDAEKTVHGDRAPLPPLPLAWERNHLIQPPR